MIWALVTSTNSFPANLSLALLTLVHTGLPLAYTLLRSCAPAISSAFLHQTTPSITSLLNATYSERAFLTMPHTSRHSLSLNLFLFFSRSFTTSYDSTIFAYSVFPPRECKPHEKINFFCLLSIFLEQSLAQNGCSKNICWLKEQSITLVLLIL